MKTSIMLSWVSAALVMASACVASAQGADHKRTGSPHSSGTTKTKTTPSKTANDAWVVVEIGEEYKVVRQADLQKERQRAADDYKKSMKEWQDAKKTDPSAEKPPKLIVKIVKQGFNTQKGAEEYRQTLIKEDKPDGKPDTRPRVKPRPKTIDF